MNSLLHFKRLGWMLLTAFFAQYAQATDPVDLARYKQRYSSVTNFFLGSVQQVKHLEPVPPVEIPVRLSDPIGITYYWVRVKVTKVLRGDLKPGTLVDLIWTIPIFRKDVIVDTPFYISDEVLKGKETLWGVTELIEEDEGRPKACLVDFSTISQDAAHLEIIEILRKEDEAKKPAPPSAGNKK